MLFGRAIGRTIGATGHQIVLPSIKVVTNELRKIGLPLQFSSSHRQVRNRAQKFLTIRSAFLLRLMLIHSLFLPLTLLLTAHAVPTLLNATMSLLTARKAPINPLVNELVDIDSTSCRLRLARVNRVMSEAYDMSSDTQHVKGDDHAITSSRRMRAWFRKCSSQLLQAEGRRGSSL
ncbi:hypothetical protein GYMLUDRAFT_674811 [Collybiopsis luxurians FD-317 M1]|uniref:Uncharacterized protein n=1 Tax=Collybiopsis luxurians FD-317 M1 TaxID=944289 RepID=A0A0D0CTU6_9AGAR|nr:hypothetical protein GYMLUDRAFT_674811 [Collybiopsis luxurians FD-317 M1]